MENEENWNVGKASKKQALSGKVCFLCLKSNKKACPKGQGSSQSQWQGFNSGGGLHEDQALYNRFLHFCQAYLKVEAVPRVLEDDGNMDSDEIPRNESPQFDFCFQCERLLSALLNIYGEITSLRARLLWSVGQLGEILKQSSNSRGKSKEQSEIIDLFRKEVEEKCHSKAQIVQPEVLIRTTLPRPPTTRSGRIVKKPRTIYLDNVKNEDDENDEHVEWDPLDEDLSSGNSETEIDDPLAEEIDKTVSKVKSEDTPSTRPTRKWFSSKVVKRSTRGMKRKRVPPLKTSIGAGKNKLVKDVKKSALVTPTRPPNHNCSHCSSEFRNRLQLLQHMAMVHEGLSKDFLTCAVCHQVTDGFSELQKHLEEKHEDPDCKPIYCVFCFQNFTTQQLSDLHRREQHSKVYLARCPLLFCDKDECPEKFMNVTDLNEHLRTHVTPTPTSTEDGVFVCPKCGRGFLNSTRCKLHQILHIPKDAEGFYHCLQYEKCGVKLRGQRKLLNHYNKKHVDINKRLALHACDLCKKRPYFISRKDLETHSKRHALEIKCRICGEVCLGSNELVVHKYNKHPDEFNFNQMPKPQKKNLEEEEKEEVMVEANGKNETHVAGLLRKCAYCPNKFLTFPELEKHKALAHGINANKPQPGRLVCDICGLVLRYKGTLNRHLLTHSEPTLECPFKCGKKFRRVGNMEMHIMKTHKKGECEPQFVCDICGRGYLSRGLLNRHKKEHEKLYKCPICEKMVRTTSRLKEHLRATHSEERFNCKWCSSVYTWETKLIAHVKKKHPEHYQDYYADRVKWRTLTKIGDDNGVEGTGMGGNPDIKEKVANSEEQIMEVEESIFPHELSQKDFEGVRDDEDAFEIEGIECYIEPSSKLEIDPLLNESPDTIHSLSASQGITGEEDPEKKLDVAVALSGLAMAPIDIDDKNAK